MGHGQHATAAWSSRPTLVSHSQRFFIARITVTAYPHFRSRWFVAMPAF